MKRTISLFAILMLSAILLSGCFNKSEEVSTEQPLKVNVMGYDKTDLLELLSEGKMDGVKFIIDTPIEKVTAEWGKPDYLGFAYGGSQLDYESKNIFFSTDDVGLDGGPGGNIFSIGVNGKKELFGVNIGMTFMEIKEVLGAPDSENYYRSNDEEEGVTLDYWYLRYKRGDYTLTFLAEDSNAPTYYAEVRRTSNLLYPNKGQNEESTATQTDLQPSDAARAAANADNSGVPYFVVYNYDEANYLVSGYQSQKGPGNYVGGTELYLVNKSSGKVLANSQIDFSKVDFNKYLAVYSKLTGEIIE